MPGVVELLRALRSPVRVCVVTNNLVVEQVEKLAHLEMTDLVDVLVISLGVAGERKHPQPGRRWTRRCVARRHVTRSAFPRPDRSRR